MKPQALKMGNSLTWRAMIASLQPKTPFPPTAKLTTYALWDGTQINDDGTGALLQEFAFSVFSGSRVEKYHF